MTLQAVTSGRRERPFRICVYGPGGIGKSTFAAQAPNPIFIPIEEGTDEIETNRFPQPDNWEEVKDALRILLKDKHEYQTLVIDTLDALEQLIWVEVCRKYNKSTIEEFDYFKGHAHATKWWRELLKILDVLRDKRGMNTILLAHSQVKKLKNPGGADYDKYQLPLYKEAAAEVRHWCDALLFANFETFVTKLNGKLQGVGGETRLLHAENRPAFDAKNRYGLPAVFALDYNEFELGRKMGPGAPGKYKAEIRALAEGADEELKKQALDFMEKAGDDSLKLSKTADWLRGKVNTNE